MIVSIVVGFTIAWFVAGIASAIKCVIVLRRSLELVDVYYSMPLIIVGGIVSYAIVFHPKFSGELREEETGL